MTVFWLLAAALMAGAMAWLLLPLLRPARHARAPGGPAPMVDLYRGQLEDIEADERRGELDAAHAGEARDEIGRRLLDEAGPGSPRLRDAPSPLLAALLLALLPSAAIVLYLHLGNPVALWQVDDADHAHASDRAPSAAQIEGMVNQLAQRLRTEPDDAEGWSMLARSYAALDRPADAAVAYARAIALAPDEAALRADYADVLASVDGGRLNGRASAQIERALALDAHQPKALALAASAAMERGDAPEAVRRWQQLQRLLPPDSQTAARVAANIAQAQAPAAPAAEASLAGRVRLGGQTGRTPAPDETVFVYARTTQGPRLPLAVLKRRVAELPFAFVLDDSLAMRPDHRLSGAGEVIVEARISRSGNASPGEGDLVGRTGPVAVGRRDLEIVIDGPAASAAGPASPGTPQR